MNINKKKKVVSMMLCVAMLAPMASMAMPVGAQGEDAFASQPISGQVGIKDINASQIRNQWALYNPSYTTSEGTCIDIDVESIWDKGVTGSEDIVIAVLDDGIDYEHEDLNDEKNSKCNIWEDEDGHYGYNACNNTENSPFDTYNIPIMAQNGYSEYDGSDHGTRIANVIGAIGDNEKGMSGVMQDVKIMPIKIFDSFRGREKTSDEILLSAFQFLKSRIVNFDINIAAVNIPFDIRKEISDNGYKDDLLNIIQDLGKNYGVLTVYAASEDDFTTDLDLTHPAFNYMVSVGSINYDGSYISGKEADILAPGCDVLTATHSYKKMKNADSKFINNGLHTSTGNDYAAAFVSGSIGLLSAYIDSDENEEKDNWTNDKGQKALAIRNRIINGANKDLDKLKDKSVSGGFLNLGCALNCDSTFLGNGLYYDSYGNIAKGFKNNVVGHEGKTLYFENGRAANGWFKDNNNPDSRWYYAKTAGDVEYKGEGDTGEVITGEWTDSYGNEYYFVEKDEYGRKKGELFTGWHFNGGKWYYYSEDTNDKEKHLGEMQKGWTYVMDKDLYGEDNELKYRQYYLNKETGAMHTGWFNDESGATYFFSRTSEMKFKEGEMVVGWFEIDDNLYYFKEDGPRQGQMVKGGLVNINGQDYYFDENGKCVEDLEVINEI